MLSYPLGPRGWLTLFNTNTYAAKLKELIEHPDSNVIIIYGDRDEFTDVGSYRAWREKVLEGYVRKARVVDMAGDHFWRGPRGQEMTQIVEGWLP